LQMFCAITSVFRKLCWCQIALIGGLQAIRSNG